MSAWIHPASRARNMAPYLLKRISYEMGNTASG
jgi:hypothetical protein